MDPFHILYEDNEVLVCHKNAGLATQTKSFREKDLESLLKNYRLQKKETPYIGVIHRLDQPVEGLLLFAKTPAAAAKLSAQVTAHTLGKHYLALCQKSNDTKELSTEGTLTNFLLNDSKTNLSQVVAPDTNGAKKATLSYRILDKKDDLTLFAITLGTGRHHQIRVQLSSAGYPICGDLKYGLCEEANALPLALCSYKLSFVHPSTKKVMEFTTKPVNPRFEGYRFDL